MMNESDLINVRARLAEIEKRLNHSDTNQILFEELLKTQDSQVENLNNIVWKSGGTYKPITERLAEFDVYRFQLADDIAKLEDNRAETSNKLWSMVIGVVALLLGIVINTELFVTAPKRPELKQQDIPPKHQSKAI